ncbi:MAG: hypothetical protein DMD33_12140 [Gemmatimonadetes bacterium]|nr:MAG: hypothetical protein DMD33_12140 [Gemmatimonadota bacterium]
MLHAHPVIELRLPRHVLGAVALLLVALSCSSTVEPRAGVTLLVTNGTCVPGPCSPLEILGFPSNQPATPGGYWSLDLGAMSGAALCVTIPVSATFRVIGVNANGSADTRIYTWTSAMGLSLGVQAPSAPRIMAAPSTRAFVPATAAGWQIALPGGSQIAPSPLCANALR